MGGPWPAGEVVMKHIMGHGNMQPTTAARLQPQKRKAGETRLSLHEDKAEMRLG